MEVIEWLPKSFLSCVLLYVYERQKAKLVEYFKEYSKRPDVRKKYNERKRLKRKLDPEKARERDKKYRERNKLNAAVSKKRRETIRLWAQKKEQQMSFID